MPNLCIVVPDIPSQHRRVQGLLPRRLSEDRLAAHGGTEETLPNPVNPPHPTVPTSPAPRGNSILY